MDRDDAPVYREHPAPAGLAALVACTWDHAPADDLVQRVVPDGCVDLVWLADRTLVVAGADTGPKEVSLPAGRPSTGIRLRPGAAGAALGLPASELCDRQVALEDVWGEPARRLADALSAASAEPGRRRALLAAAVADRGAEPDALVAQAARRLARPVGPGARTDRIARVAAELGVAERTLHRRTLAAVGYGPKVLARVARLRRLVGLGEDALASRALEAGYASQAHMTDEVRRLTGLTPVRFLKDAAATAA